MTITVQYVSGVPGLGKTRAAVNYMAEHIRNGIAGKNAGYIFYVAPTRELLKQTLNNLKALLTEDEQRMVRAEYSRKGSADSTVAQRVRATLDGRALDTRAVLPFVQGSILFLTHTGFITLRRHEKFEDTTVIFDESRKWVTDVIGLRLNGAAERLFNKLFTVEDLLDNRTNRPSGLISLRPRPVTRAEVSEMVRSKGEQKVISQLRTIHDDLASHDGNPSRMQMFGALHRSGDGRKLVGIAMPSHPFVGFRRVLIMSADFENSQMYHLLRMEGCNVKNVTAKFLRQHLDGGFDRALGEVTARYEKLTIVPLLTDSEMPSFGQLDVGVLLPDAKLVEFKQKMDELELTGAELNDLIRTLRDPDLSKGILRPNQVAMQSYMRTSGFEIDSLKWMVGASKKLVHSWWKKNPPTVRDDATQLGVMILNPDYQDYAIHTRHFNYLSVGRVEGRNGFMHSNAVAFLAAMNPKPVVKQLLNALLPDYDADEDYVVDKAIQSLGRGNIRNHHTKKRMLAIVSTQGLAEKVRARMQNYPKIDLGPTEALGNMRRWNHNKATAQERAQATGTADRVARFTESLGDNRKMYNALSGKIFRLKKKLRETGDISIAAQITELEAQRATLKAG